MENLGKPLGSRVLVEPEEPVDVVSKRMKDLGLAVVIDPRNKPRPTCGKVVEMGSDPLLLELGLVIGIRVGFGVNAGTRQTINGKEYRLLESQEIDMILPPLKAESEVKP